LSIGKFTGIGVGPGDPELLTLKAVRALHEADVVIAPRTEKRDDSIALSIARPHMRQETEVLELIFPMVYHAGSLSDAWRENRDIIQKRLNAGQNVVFLTLGDPMFYSTYIYVFELLQGCGHPIETVPGVTAFCAIASHHGTPIVEGDDVLSVVPATISPEKLEKVLAVSDRLVLMKISRKFEELRQRLQKHGFADHALMVSKCGQPEEEVHEDFLAVQAADVTYLSTILTRRNKSVTATVSGAGVIKNAKKALLVVSFGTSVIETRKANIDVLEQDLQAQYPDWTVRRAFTSKTVRARIAADEGLIIDSAQEALERLQQEGFSEVLVQPTHIIPGEEYDRLIEAMAQFHQAGAFASLKLGRPILCQEGLAAGQVDDFKIAVAALQTQLPVCSDAERIHVVLMGHGSGGHVADRCYDLLQERLDAAGLPVFTATVEGGRTFEAAVEWLEREQAQRVVLMPFMLVAGDHALNDMAGPEEDSWQSQLTEAGYRVESILQGLGENPAFRKIYLQHVAEAVPFAETIACDCK
jgi:precorrin-2/cobalt-factor-2 C20-methyltransferase